MAAEEATSTNDNTVSFTDGESKLFISMMKHLASDIQFDADAVAAELGYKDGSIVKTRWNQIKRKKLAAIGASPTGGIKKRSPKKTSPKKQDKVTSDADDAETITTPATKRGRKPKAENAGKSESESVDVKKEDEDGDGNVNGDGDGEGDAEMEAE